MQEQRIQVFMVILEAQMELFESPANLGLIESNITVATAPFGAWAGLYSNIHKVNDFLENIQGTPFGNEIDKNQLIGQAYGLRAFYYYTLLKTWGDVPISTVPLTTVDPSNLSKARSPQSEVMALIKADLEASLTAFGSDNSFFGGTRVYWSKAATLALKGDVYIWSGNLMGGGAADFTTAKTALEQISALGVSLAPSIADLWNVSNENNSEFIFAVDYKQDEASNFYNSLTGRSTEINPQFTQDGSALTDFIINGANRYGPTEKTLLVLDDVEDARRDATFIRLYTDNATYPTYDPTNYFGSIFNKYLGQVVGTERIFENNTAIYRYADVVLMLAEVKNLLGEDPTNEINAIRARAYGANYNVAIHGFINGTPTSNANAILEERYKEFVGEGKRWWDLRRAGDNFVINNISFLNSGDEFKLVLPITIDMIGRNPLLVQTPGYN